MMMSAASTYRLVLVGPYAGKTVTFRSFKFEKGVCELVGIPEHVAGPMNYLKKSYGAYLEGTEEYREAVRRYKEITNGERDDTETGEPTRERDDGAVQQGGGEPSEETTAEGPGHGEAESGEAGRDTGGSGHEHPGMDGNEENRRNDSDPLRRAVMSLDPDDSELWTDAGLPTMLAVQEAYGSGGVTRRMVGEVAGDWTRDKAREAQLNKLLSSEN